MKKRSFLGLALIAGSTLNAQNSAEIERLEVPSKTNEIVNATLSNRLIDISAAFFYEDFAMGLDGNNGFVAWTAEGADVTEFTTGLYYHYSLTVNGQKLTLKMVVTE